MNKIFDVYTLDNKYREDIQGVRAIGAMLVLVFHIWFQKVSGGVDVFFVVSGFLMTGMLLRQYAKEGSIKPFHFWGGIIKRVAPSAYVVLLTTFILSYFFVPPVYWVATIHEFIFSAGHLENLLLIRREIDYLQIGDPASPFQQYWALSMQVQFYAFFPFLIWPLLYISSRIKSLMPLILGVSAVVLFSFIYSLISTHYTPDTAYFNPIARVWEFLTGALAAIFIPYINLSKKYASALSLLGVVVLFSVGIFLPREWNFPGYVSLFPVISAVFLIISGNKSEYKTLMNRLLSNRYLVMFGAMSFTIYLWHWPILVFFQHYYETTSLGVIKGLLVVILSVLLAIITTWLVEKPFRRIPKSRIWISYIAGFLFFIPSVTLGLGAKYYIENLHDVSVVFKDSFFNGSEISIQNNASSLSYSYVTAISNDLGEAMSRDNDCAATVAESEISTCEFGDVTSDSVVALVGGSHIGQWEPFFTNLAEEYGFKIVSIIKQSCSLGYEIVEDNDTCKLWNESIVEYLSELSPDLIITNSTRSNRPRDNRLVADNVIEFVPTGHVEKWKEIATLGIPVMGIRDNPWFESDPSYCVWKNRQEASQCARPIDEVLLKDNPIEAYVGEIPLFISIDFTELICVDGLCPAYFDGRLMWSDTHHLTRNYLEYITPSLKASLEHQTSIFQTFDNHGESD
ncbi:acyltransferase family protein [Vreelandella titanicae]|uniref:acyltransferase family protein n=1 Tax=Vreelandella titanicae TaxID=664683 RepID=UPI001647FF0E|nr:acyltransferase family protein [Halomonas titanicae]